MTATALPATAESTYIETPELSKVLQAAASQILVELDRARDLPEDWLHRLATTDTLDDVIEGILNDLQVEEVLAIIEQFNISRIGADKEKALPKAVNDGVVVCLTVALRKRLLQRKPNIRRRISSNDSKWSATVNSAVPTAVAAAA